MSLTGSERVTCVCGAPVEVTLADSINAVRHPHLRAMVLERRLHRFECGTCGRILAFDKPLSYVDVERRQFLHVAPRAELHRAAELVELTRSLYARAFSVGPEAMQAEGSGYFVRLCFGYEELREKLLAFDHGLNDLVLEVLKCELLAAEPSLLASGVLTLFLEAVRDDGSLELRPERLSPTAEATGAPASITVQRAFYDHLAARYPEVLARRPQLASGPHVSLLRLLDWPAPAVPAAATVRRSLL